MFLSDVMKMSMDLNECDLDIRLTYVLVTAAVHLLCCNHCRQKNPGVTIDLNYVKVTHKICKDIIIFSK